MTVGTGAVGNATVGSLASALSEPDPPSDLKTTSNGDDTTLNWTLSPTDANDVAGQRLYRSTTATPSFPADFSQIDSIGPTVTTATDSDAPAADPLTYAVTAYNGAGESAPALGSLSVFNRSVTISGDGGQAGTRRLTKHRSPSCVADAALSASRETAKPRQTILYGRNSAIASLRSLTKDRALALADDGRVDAVGQFSEPFPSETTRDLDWEYSFDRRGFESQWSYQVGSDGAGSVALYIEGRIGDLDPATPTATIDYDASGDGGVDERSLSRPVPATGHPVVFPELSGGDGYYRVLLQDLRPDDILVAVTVGPTHT